MSRLIIAGSKVHALDKQGLSPGHRAAQFGQDGVLQTLLHAGLEVEFMSGISGDGGFFGFEAATPLHVAARFGHRQVLRVRECREDLVIGTVLHGFAAAAGECLPISRCHQCGSWQGLLFCKSQRLIHAVATSSQSEAPSYLQDSFPERNAS